MNTGIGPMRGMILLAATLVLLATPLTACVPPEQAPIMFGDLPWDSALVNNRIAAFILMHGYGYEDIEFVPGDTATIFQGLRRGYVHINMEVWVESQQEEYDDAVAVGDITDLGTNFDDNWQGWLIPLYVVEGDPERGIEPLAPEIETVFDMNDHWQLFRDPEQPTRGRFVNGAPGWEATEINSLKLNTYGLDEYYTDLVARSEEALVGSMTGAYERGEPWFGYHWAPSAALGKFDMYRLEEPEFDENIWGTTYACAYPSNNVNIAVNAEFAARYGEPVEFLQNYTTKAEQHSTVLAYLDEQNASHEEAAIYYLREYEDWWIRWVPADVFQAVQNALQHSRS